jgi:ubiquinone/menaquinone biosynthesis C-methylase UbiE
MKLRKYLSAILRPSVGISNESLREQWLEKALKSIPDGSKILDAGAGTQRYRRFCKHLEYVSQDFGQYDGKGDTTGLQTGEFHYGKLDIVSDITSIPMPDDSFDAILCVEVLEHLPDPILALTEFSRLLRPGGTLIMTAPFCSWTHFAPYHFSTGFNRYWYEKHLPDQGFIINEISPNGNYFEFIAQELYRISSVSRQYARREPALLELAAIYIILRMLRRFSKQDNGSSEFLCFGFHVFAQKKAEVT